MAEVPPTSVIGQTYHSTLDTCLHGTAVAVLKKCRNTNDPRTRTRWNNEVAALKIAGTHHMHRVHLAQDNLALLLASDPANLTVTLRLEHGKSLDKFTDVEQQQQQQQQQHYCVLSHDSGETILRQIASALAHLHVRRLVHDDVKPENIMWDPLRSRAVLVDFGAALDLAALPNDYFNPSGTPSYAAPEFLCRRKGAEGDVWALGVTMLFVWRRVALPQGEWFLPGVWDEGGDDEMRKWLAGVDELGQLERKQGTILGEMLQKDPGQRIASVELAQRLLSPVLRHLLQ